MRLLAALPCPLLACLLLSGCISPVDYGEVRHTAYVADPRCAAAAGASVDAAALPLFFVTSRLPDCRTEAITLTNHRGDIVRYGRFAAPRESEIGGRKKFRTPMAFQNEGDWWQALQAETDRRQGQSAAGRGSFWLPPRSVEPIVIPCAYRALHRCICHCLQGVRA